MLRCVDLRVCVAIASLAAAVAVADQDAQSKTVIGPSNPDLYYGAEALMAGDGQEGVRRTLLGLQYAQGLREQKIGHGNLCAGFLMLDQPETALHHCNWVLQRDERHWRTYNNRALVYLSLKRYDESEADIAKGQALNPKSETLKEVKGLYLDEVEPVSEKILMDDRRNEPETPIRPPD